MSDPASLPPTGLKVADAIALAQTVITAITGYFMYRSLLTWKEQERYTKRSDAAEDLLVATQACRARIVESRQAGFAPKEALPGSFKLEGLDPQEIQSAQYYFYSSFVVNNGRKEFGDLRDMLTKVEIYFGEETAESVRKILLLRDRIDELSFRGAQIAAKSAPPEDFLFDEQEFLAFCTMNNDNDLVTRPLEEAVLTIQRTIKDEKLV